MEKTCKPRYPHTCQSCRFLNSYLDYDLYYCAGRKEITIRWGHEPYRFISAPTSASDGFQVLRVAKSIAADMGLLTG